MVAALETGMFVDEPAWHGLGKVVEGEKTIEESIVESGLDWNVNLIDLFIVLLYLSI